jgi:hypothetical protein
MNERIFLRFESQGKPLLVRSFSPEEGLVFEGCRDASPLNIALGIKPVLPLLLQSVQRRRDWRNREFKLDANLEAGGIVFSGYGCDPEGLPPGPYDITVQIESYRFKKDWARVVVHKGKTVEIVLEEDPDPRRIQLRDNIDDLTAEILSRQTSKVDDTQAMTWLRSTNPRPARQACLLNILAKMRVPAAPTQQLPDPLSGFLDAIYFADADRVYATVKGDLKKVLKSLVSKGLWAFEGIPLAPIHYRVVSIGGTLGICSPDLGDFVLESYRQGGRNCLQIVTARHKRSGETVVDLDIDLGNPLWDFVGLIVHVGELLDPGRTDHLKLYRSLNSGDTKDFLYYDVV